MGFLTKRFLVRQSKTLIQLLALMAVTPMAMAYIGPGSGISVIGSLLGLLATILLTVGAIALFPIRRMMKKRAQAQAVESEEIESGAAPAEAADAGDVNPK